MSGMLQITEPVSADESIESFEYVEYTAAQSTNINASQAIDIVAEGGDDYLCPWGSYLQVEGQLITAAGAAYAAGDRVTLINNAVAYLFSQIRYFIWDQEVENVNFPGQVTTMKGLLSYSNDFAKGEGLGLCWTKDTSADTVLANNLGFAARQSLVVAKPNPRGTFSFCVSLEHLFGFCQDYHKVIYGCKHRLNLARQADSDAIYRDGGVGAGRIALSKISWFMPKVVPSLAYKNMLTSVIEKKESLDVAYRAMQCEQRAMPPATSDTWEVTTKTGTERPRWLLVGFQTGKAADQTQNPAIFDNVGLTNIYATVNDKRYPDADMTSNFTTYQTGRLYRAMTQFKAEFFDVPGKESTSSVTPIEFVELFPVHVIDLRRQPEKLKDVPLNIKIKTTFSAAVPAGTLGYAVLISDRSFKLDSDGRRFKVVTS